MGHYKLLLVLLLASTVSGATVGTPVTVAAGQNNSGATLAIPRLKCGFLNDSLYIIPAQGSSADSAWFYSADEGATWLDVSAGNQLSQSATNMHLAVWFDAGGAHLTGPGATDVEYHRLSRPMTQFSDTGGVVTIYDGFTTEGRSTVCSRGDTTWIAARSITAAEWDTVYIWWSVDDFATISDSAHREVSAGNQRIFLAVDNTGLPHLWYFEFALGYYQVEWQGPVTNTFAGAADSGVVEDVGLGAGDRVFSVVYTDEWHLVYGEGAGDDSLVHVAEDGGSWTRSIVSVNDDDPLVFAPMMTERAGVLYVFYFLQDEQQLVFKSNSGGGWGDSTLVSASDVVDGTVGIQTPYSIPLSIGYIPVWYVTTGDVLRFNALGLGAQGLSGSVSLTGGVTIQ